MPKYFDKQPDGSFIEFSAEEKGYQAGCILVLILSSIVFCLAVKYLPNWVWVFILQFVVEVWTILEGIVAAIVEFFSSFKKTP